MACKSKVLYIHEQFISWLIKEWPSLRACTTTTTAVMLRFAPQRLGLPPLVTIVLPLIVVLAVIIVLSSKNEGLVMSADTCHGCASDDSLHGRHLRGMRGALLVVKGNRRRVNTKGAGH
jgi:hypothetical protein